MSCKPKAKSLRAADGMELMTRFGKSIRAADGFGMPMNKTPMSAQDQQAFSNIQNTPSAATPQAASAAPKSISGSAGVTGAGMLNSAPQMAMPTLQLAEGGEVSALSIKGLGRSMGFFKSPEEKYAEREAAYKAKQAASPAPAPAPAAPAPTQGIAGYVGNGALDKRMAAAGLRNGGDLETGHGGVVPGTGSGDKIPAKYEPGEFVVSNDMLDAQPELRGHLRGLREAVLAQKGMTPEQADAKAVGVRGLRAFDGADLIPGQSMKAPAFDGHDNGNEFTRNVNNSLNALGGMGVVASVPLRTAQAGSAALRGSTAAAAATPLRALPNQIPRLSGPVAQAAQAAPDFIAGSTGVAKVGGANLPTVVSNASNLPAVATNTVVPATRMTNVALQEGAKANQMAAATRSLGNASAWVSELQSQLQSQQPLPTPPVAQASPTPAPVVDPNAQSKARGLRLGDPSSSDLKDEFSNASIESRNPGGKVTKVVGPGGKVSYSGGNVSGEVSFQGADGNALRGRQNGGYSDMMGDPAARAKAAASDASAADNAIMAANLRDGVDIYRGTSKQREGADKYANMPIKMATAMRVADAQAASARENAQLSADTSLRTTSMNNETSLAGNKMTNAFGWKKFGIEQANKDREFARDTANDAFTQGEAGTKSFMDHANSLFQTQDKDGKMISDPQKTAAYTSAVTDTIGHLAAQYANSPDPKQRAYAADLAKRGPAALDAADRAALPMLFERQQLHAASTGLSPFASGGATSKNLLDYTDAGQTSTGWQQRRKLKGGQEIPESNLRYGADANHLMPNWGSGSNYLGAK